MSVPSVAAEVSGTEDVAAITAHGSHPVVSGVGSALLLWAAFPPADWGWLAWVALVPLFLLVPSQRSRRSLYLGAWVGGLVFWTMAVQWVRLTDATAWLAWLTMALALSFFWPVFLALARLAVFKTKLPVMIAAPMVWVALEYVRAYAVSGFPWYYLAHSQHTTLSVIQVADLTGSLGVSLVIAVVNAWIVDLLRLPLLRETVRGPRLTARQTRRVAIVAGLLVVTLGYGAFRLGTAQFRDGPRVALLQTNLIQRYKDKATPDQILAKYSALIENAARGAKRPDLIVWPETSYPYGVAVIDPAVGDAALAKQLKRIAPKFTTEAWRRRTEEVRAILHRWTDSVDIPMLVGVLTYDHRPGDVSKFNSASLFEPGLATIQSYHKLHLVPFGEYVPLVETLPWLTVFTPYRGPDAYVPSLNFGHEPAVIKLGPYRIATAICFEDTVPQVVRRFFSDPPDGQPPDMLLNLSNDGWFHESSEHEAHLAASVFRAVENRVPLARAANTGISAIVDGNGRVREMLETMKEGVVSGVMPLDDRNSIYSAWGDWLGVGCLAVTLGLVPVAVLRPRLDRRLAVT